MLGVGVGETAGVVVGVVGVEIGEAVGITAGVDVETGVGVETGVALPVALLPVELVDRVTGTLVLVAVDAGEVELVWLAPWS